ncbi:hypothetical protein AB0E27_15295 [Streptomyces sparsogenes]|uniref:hypothetical protein n=1 Tax=Streptomyces sparsogenes TaxID=67365 RepID=UPI0033E27806
MSDATGLLADKERAGVIRAVLSNNPGMEEDTAARIVNEAIKFTATCAKFPEARLRPSRVVDEGWHALILHTRVYKDLCDKFGLGRTSTALGRGRAGLSEPCGRVVVKALKRKAPGERGC